MEINDYKAWAHGLKKAGYATNPKYPHLLIKIIKDYELDQFDNLFEPGPGPMVASSDDNFMLNEIARIEGERKQSEETKTKSKTKPKKRNILATNHREVATKKLNDISVFYATHDDTPETIAAKTNVPMKRLFKYNEGLTNANQALTENTVVFLQPKRKAFRGKKKFHKVSDGETLAQVSQKYGICTEKLQERNRLAANEEPLEGAILKIRGKRVPENMRIPTREVYVEGQSNNKEEVKKMEKYATSLSDFEAPPSIQERKEQAKVEKSKRLFNFGKNKKVTSTSTSDKTPPSDIYKASPAFGDEAADIVGIESRKETYSAPSTSSNYSTTPSSGNATFKEEVSSSTKPYTTPSSSESYTRPRTAVVANTPAASSSSSAPSSTSTYSGQSATTYSSQNATAPNIIDNTADVQNTRIITTPTTTSTGTTNYTTNTSTVINTPQAVVTQYHTVAKGETLYRLSKNYGKTVDYLKQVNSLNTNTISIGQKLIVN